MKYIYRVEAVNLARIAYNMGATGDEYQLQVVEPSPSLHLVKELLELQIKNQTLVNNSM